MLRPYRPLLEKQTLILASGSERRRHLLTTLAGLADLRVIKSDCKEDLDKTVYKDKVEEYALDTARLKADDVLNNKLREEIVERPLVIAADTIVVVNTNSSDDVIIEKAKSRKEAVDMLSLLVEARSHRVITGVSVRSPLLGVAEFTEETKVHFDQSMVTREMIEGYVDNQSNVLDMAGAYGIQTEACTFIESIEGDYYNVMGMPINKLCRTLVQLCKEYQSQGDNTFS